jgi:ATP-dependent helicase/nuclease subunit B
MLKVLISSAASDRLSAAAQFLSGFPRSEMLVIGGTRATADDFVRHYARLQGATFGIHRLSMVQLAARISALRLAANGGVPCSALSMEATVMRAVHEAHGNGFLEYFSPVALLPGFAKAVRATASELRAAGIAAVDLEHLPPPGLDVSSLLAAIEGQLTAAHLVDMASLMRTASSVLHAKEASLANRAVLLLDIPIHSKAEYEFVEALASTAPEVLVTLPAEDEKSGVAVKTLRATKCIERSATEESGLGRLRQYLFSEVKPPSGERDDQIRMFSAPGEGRECVEVARRILEEAHNGTRFDQIAVFLRSPTTYSGLLDSALRRAGIPAFFSSGTSRPDPAGRAFLALLACADEKLSAKRFAEYLSLGQVPVLNESGGPPEGKQTWIAAEDEMLGLGLTAPVPAAAEASEKTGNDGEDSDDSPQIGGTLRAPWNWEELLVDAAVIGGKDRWERRLNGLDAEFRLKLREVVGKEPESPRAAAIQREIRELSHLKKFALPLIEVLSGFPKEAHWG